MEMRLLAALAAVFLSATASFAQNGNEITGKVDLKGDYSTAVIADPNNVGGVNKYDAKDTTVTAEYKIATKVDPVSMKKVFDLEKSTVTFENEWSPGTKYKTPPMPITEIKGDPETGKIESFKTKGSGWDSSRKEESDLLEGEVTLARGKTPAKAKIKSRYNFKSDMQIIGYTFESVVRPPKKEAKNSKKTGGKPVSIKTKTKTSGVSYDASTSVLSIDGDTVTEASVPGDPIVGTSLFFDDYSYSGLTSDGELAIFWSLGDGLMEMSTGGGLALASSISTLYYHLGSDLFFSPIYQFSLGGVGLDSPFYDPTLDQIASPFMQGVDSIMNPLSDEYDSSVEFYFTLETDGDFFDLTNGFTASANADAQDAHYVTTPVPLPIPALALLTGLAGLWVMRPRKI